jgi:hypothetical protein
MFKFFYLYLIFWCKTNELKKFIYLILLLERKITDQGESRVKLLAPTKDGFIGWRNHHYKELTKKSNYDIN